jgi:hypothetical protein
MASWELTVRLPASSQALVFTTGKYMRHFLKSQMTNVVFNDNTNFAL